MSKLSKHLGLGEPLKIGDDEFIIKPLGTKEIPLFFKVMKTFGTIKDDNMDDVLKNASDESLEAMRDLIDKTLEKSMPEELEEDRSAFGMKYMGQLLEKIMTLNMAVDESHENVKKVEALKARMAKNEPNTVPKTEGVTK